MNNVYVAQYQCDSDVLFATSSLDKDVLIKAFTSTLKEDYSVDVEIEDLIPYDNDTYEEDGIWTFIVKECGHDLVIPLYRNTIITVSKLKMW